MEVQVVTQKISRSVDLEEEVQVVIDLQYQVKVLVEERLLKPPKHLVLQVLQ